MKKEKKHTIRRVTPPEETGLGYKDRPDSAWSAECFFRAILHEGGQLLLSKNSAHYLPPAVWDEKTTSRRLKWAMHQENRFSEFAENRCAVELLVAETLSISDAARLLNLSESVVKSGAINGRFGSMRYSGVWRISKYHLQNAHPAGGLNER